MRTAFLILVFVGCASSPRLRVQQLNDTAGNPPAAPFDVGTCAASIRVRVVDAQRHPVGGAEVVAVRVISNRAPSMAPSVDTYRSQPVATDRNGEARICNPDRLHDLGGYDFASVRTSVIEARRGAEVVTLAAPFDAPIVLTR